MRAACASKNLDAVPYCAPLQKFDSQRKEVVLYMVYLAPGHSLDQHQQEAGLAALDVVYVTPLRYPANTIRVYENLFPNKLCYAARLDSDQLGRVRGDPGVELVECIVNFRKCQ
ncbi:hypothetical protein LTR85_010197 [Meristemomyces frigidus]|nr:hypothetical protein LTR85_010197 [Meristemomyces frigidus]